MADVSERDDLFGYGIIGLIDAIEKFELDRGVRFEAYAERRIRGAIIDNQRRVDRVPRVVRANSRRIAAANATLDQQLGRTPTSAEVTVALGVSPAHYHEMRKQEADASVWSIDYTDLPACVAADTDPAAPLLEADEFDALRAGLLAAIDSLGDREAIVILLYFVEGLTLQQIADELGVSKTRVSQIHTEALLELRTLFGGSHEPLAQI